MNANDDLADVEAVLNGDIDAFANIVRRWEGPLVNLAYRFCRDRSRAEDMAQEAFLRTFRNLHSWRRDAAFSTWLFALASNLYRTELRRIPLRSVALEERLSVAIPPPPDDSRDEAVRDAVATLPAKYRDSLALFYFHEMDIAAAARTLNLPQGTVKARLSRGRALLREKLSRLLSRSEKMEVR